MFTMSKKEFEFMEILWEAGRPLARQEILDWIAVHPQSWKPNSVHILVNALMKKGTVRIAGYYLNARKLGRTYEAAVSKEEYALMQAELAVQEAARMAGSEPEQVLWKLVSRLPEKSEADQG